MLPQPKPEPRKRAKARARRQAADVVKRVRAFVGMRDGQCRVGSTTRLFGACEGVSEWAHLEEFRRFKTQGQPADVRHTSAGTCRLCSLHHWMYDRTKTLTVEFLTEAGANGTIRFTRDGVSVLSIPDVVGGDEFRRGR